MDSSGKREMLHNLTRDYRREGFSFLCASALAMRDIEARGGNAYDIRACFKPTGADERLLRSLEEQKGAA